MKLAIIILSYILLSSCSLLKPQRTPSSTNNVKYHGLENISLDLISQWTNGLYTGTNVPSLAPNISDSIYQAFKSTNNIGDFMNNILNLKLNNKYNSEDNYRNLANEIFSARKHIRQSLSINSQYTKEAMLLTELLAEETLYVESILFKSKNLIRFDFANDISGCGSRSSILNNTPLCQGDIVISKGDAGSSSFLARISDYPGNYSHSTIPYIDNKKNIFFIEAFIEDGVKLRTPSADYINDPKTKLMIYRNINPQIVKSSVVAIDKLYQIIMTNLKGSNPFTTAAFQYDFKMDATNSDRLFCSEVSYYAYGLNTAIPSYQNPYSVEYWSYVNDPTRNIVLSGFLNAKTHFPAPSDIELNPNYDVVTMQFNSTKLSADRMRVALIDVLEQVMNENQQQVITSINMLGKLGNQIVDPKIIKLKLSMFQNLGISLPTEAASMVDTIPKNINYKQLLFFSFIDKRLSPYVVAQLTLQENTLLHSGRILDLESMRVALKPLVENELKQFADMATKAMSSLP
jgi:hypothetical protein